MQRRSNDEATTKQRRSNDEATMKQRRSNDDEGNCVKRRETAAAIHSECVSERGRESDCE